jgi:integrase
VSVTTRKWTDTAGKARKAYWVRWRDENGKQRSETFDYTPDGKRAAGKLDAEVKERVKLAREGIETDTTAGLETLDEFVANVWLPEHAADLKPSTLRSYKSLYDQRIAPTFGDVPLRAVKASAIQRWYAEAWKDADSRVSAQKALTLLGGILKLAQAHDRIPGNPQRAITKKRIQKAAHVNPLTPSTVEAIRAAMLNPEPITVAASGRGKRTRRGFAQPAPGDDFTRLRDATLVSVLAYAGIRPGEEVLGLTWGDVQENTLRVRSTKTNANRTVRLLAPLAADLKAFKLASPRTADARKIFDGLDYANWPKRSWARALEAAGVAYTRPYDLRHSFASLLLAEHRTIHYVAEQLGHGPELTLGTYGHVIAEFEFAADVSADEAIRDARRTLTARAPAATAAA